MIFPGKDGCLPFEPCGILYCPDWRFEASFSPDGRWTLLQQDRVGPYTVIDESVLGQALRRELPDFTFGVELGSAPAFPDGTLASVCEGSRWGGDEAVVLTVSVHGESAEARWMRPFTLPDARRPTTPSLGP